MKKYLKILIIIGILLLLIAAGIFIYLKFINNNESYTNNDLKDEEYNVSIENLSSVYVDNQVTVFNENDRKTNSGTEIKKEKFILDDKIGMYGFSMVSDFDTTNLEFVIKNHSKEKIDKFKYRLQFCNSDGSIIGTIDLESKELPAFSKYKVKVNIDSDVINTFEIVPVTDFEEYGTNNGGRITENA